MTMQSSGQISIGQARNECGLGGEVDAGNFYLSRLAGVGQGQHYAWSYWYGKSNVTPLVNYEIGEIAVNADRYVFCYFDLLNWRFQWGQNSGDNNSGVMWVQPSNGSQQPINQGGPGITTGNVTQLQTSPIAGCGWLGLTGSPPPGITNYNNFNATITFEAGSTRTPVIVWQQPSAANSYTIGLRWDDNGPGGAAGSQYGVYLNATA